MTVPYGEDRLQGIMDVIVSLASNDFTARAGVGDGNHVLDGIAVGLNMLAEELHRQKKREVEHQLRMQRAERLAALGQLAASVAHEVNNPAAFVLANLTALREHAEVLKTFCGKVTELSARVPELDALLREGSLATRVDDMTAITADNTAGVERIVTIVKNLRQYARHDAVQDAPVPLAKVVADACALVAHQVKFRARLGMQLKATRPVRGDATRLTQVLTNLLVNAAQAIPEGQAAQHRVDVSLEESDGWAALRVQDSGPGLSAEARAHLFEPFFTTKPKETGTGLGLSISREIVRQHHGEMTLVRSDAQGTVFEVRLPVATAFDETVIATPPPVVAAVNARRILIIDDEEQLLTAYKRQFKKYDVHTALGGRAAQKLIQEDQAWDAVLCDLMMPDLDGPTLHRWVQSKFPLLEARMAFLSGGVFTPAGADFVALVPGRVLMKPLSRDQMQAVVERLSTRA